MYKKSKGVNVAAKKIIFILSNGHSGSTFLGLILGSHPEVFGLGELARLERHLPKICGICDGDCEYWKGKTSLPILRRYFAPEQSLRIISREFYRYQRSIYDYLSEWFGFSVFVDSSKYPYWIRGQLRYRKNWKNTEPYIIHLTRDGRAVINSFLRKSPDMTVQEITNRWLRSTGKNLDLYRDFDGPKLNVAYEDLAQKPEEMISKLCNFIGIDYFPEMLSYWEHEHHQIGGNTGARSLISRKSTESGHIGGAVTAGTWNKGYYREMGNSIKLDLRWKTELSSEHLAYFERYAGELNRQFSFDGPEA